MEQYACSLCFVIVSMTANQTDTWRCLARRLGMHTKDYKGRYPLVSDILYDILENWMRREESATVRRTSPRCLWCCSREGRGREERVGLEDWTVRRTFV